MSETQVHRSASGIEFVRTPDERFTNLADFAYEPKYVDIDGLRMAYLDEGPADGPLTLLLHGEPTWSYLYRRMIPGLVAAGRRIIAPDLIGFGRSDKPTERASYTYAGHVEWLRQFITALDLNAVTLFCQDWGGLLGLRLAAENAPRFERLIIANTALPDGSPMPDGFAMWRQMSQDMPFMDCGALLKGTVQARELSEPEMDGYRAPFPDELFMAGARQFPLLVPISPEDPAVPANLAAWEVLRAWTKPVLTLWAPGDFVLGTFQPSFTDTIPGAAGQPHRTFSPAGHFIQDDCGPELVEAILAWLD